MINVSLVDTDTYQVVVAKDEETTHVVRMSQEYYKKLCGATVTHEFGYFAVESRTLEVQHQHLLLLRHVASSLAQGRLRFLRRGHVCGSAR